MTISRREFCAVTGSGLVALGLPGCGSVPKATGVANAGPPAGIILNQAVFFKPQRLFVCRDAGGIFAVSSDCQHMHCDIENNNGVDPPDDGGIGKMYFYLCPCHQSGYTYTGEIVHGPTVRPLFHHPVSLDPVTGDVMADSSVILLSDADKAMRLGA